MTFNVSATIRDYGREVAILFYRDESGEITQVGKFHEGGTFSWEDYAPHTEPEPTLTLGRAEAEKLADELGFTLGGKAAMRLLRKDLDVERQRVDALIKGLLDKPQIIVTSGEVRTR